MLGANGSMEHVTGFQDRRLLRSVLAIAHLDASIQDCKYLFPVIDVPSVRLVRPMQPNRDTAHFCDIKRTPCGFCSELSGSDNLHVGPNYCYASRSRHCIESERSEEHTYELQ